jgi:hypothetical protein
MVDLTTPEAYSDVLERLERDGVRYVVISGVAVVLHGHARPIADLDIAISSVPDERDRALHTLLQAGFVPSLPLPLSMVSVLRMFDAAGREVDLFLRYHIPFDDMWAGSELMGVRGGVARVVSLEHLLRAKQIYGRPHDLLDIAALLALKAGDG